MEEAKSYLISSGKPSAIIGRAILFLIIVVPIALISSRYVNEVLPFGYLYESKKAFDEKCNIAGQEITRKIEEPIKSLYLEVGNIHYSRIKNGRYHSSSFGILAQPMLNNSALEFIEVPNHSSQKNADAHKYLRYYPGERSGTPVKERLSQYGALYEPLPREEYGSSGVLGGIIRIVDLSTHEVMATNAHFSYKRGFRFCGHAPDGSFSSSRFIREVLNVGKKKADNT